MVTPLSNSSCIFFMWTEGSVPTAHDFRTWSDGSAGVGRLLDFSRAGHVIEGLEGLRAEAPEFGRLVRGLLVADDDILFDQDRHRVGVLAGGSGAVLPLGLVLRPGLRVGDQSIAVLAGEAHGLLAVGGGQQRDRFCGWIIKPSVYVVVLAFERHVLPRPHLANDGDGLDQPVPAFLPVRPFACRDLLIQRLAGPDAEEDAAGVEMAHGSESLGRRPRGCSAASGR